MFCMTGQTPHLLIIVFGEGSSAIMSPTMSLLCEFVFLFLWKRLPFLVVISYIAFVLIVGLFCYSNLSGLNLEGEMSPAIGNLKDLTSVYCSSLPFFYFVVMLLCFYAIPPFVPLKILGWKIFRGSDLVNWKKHMFQNLFLFSPLSNSKKWSTHICFLWVRTRVITDFILSTLISDLKGNRLSGQIPDEIGDCSSLQDL